MNYLIRCAAIGAIAWLALAGCRANEGSTSPAGGHKAAADLTLEIYSVPADRAASIRDAVDNALGGIDVKLFGGARASITSAGPGKLLVYAPRDAQASIGSVIAALATSLPASAASAEPAAPGQVQIRFWIVDAIAGPGSDDPALKALAPSFESLRQTMGPLHFRLDQTTSATTSAGSSGGFITTNPGDGYTRNFNFKADAIKGDTIVLHLAYHDNANTALAELRTEIDATLGHYVVLAQAPGACPPASPGKVGAVCTNKPALRLLVVRVDRLNPSA